MAKQLSKTLAVVVVSVLIVATLHPVLRSGAALGAAADDLGTGLVAPTFELLQSSVRFDCQWKKDARTLRVSVVSHSNHYLYVDSIFTSGRSKDQKDRVIYEVGTLAPGEVVDYEIDVTSLIDAKGDDEHPADYARIEFFVRTWEDGENFYGPQVLARTYLLKCAKNAEQRERLKKQLEAKDL